MTQAKWGERFEILLFLIALNKMWKKLKMVDENIVRIPVSSVKSVILKPAMDLQPVMWEMQLTAIFWRLGIKKI